jgi:hypothetical protein
LTGCVVEIGHYQARGIVEPETAPVVATMKGLPWAPIVDFLMKLMPLAGQTRRLAIEKGRGYTEERSISLFRVEKASMSEIKTGKQGENYSSEKRQELK